MKKIDNMSLTIENKTVTEESIGRPVTYIPPQANGNAGHKDSRQGRISSFNDTYVFVRFNAPNGQACRPEDLVWG